jgi:hypothetical protein
MDKHQVRQQNRHALYLLCNITVFLPWTSRTSVIKIEFDAS